MLIRRFDGQMYHVKAIDEVPPGQLDLQISAQEEFSPDKLRSNIERVYLTVFLGLAAFGKHIARLRSWNERKRSAAFCAGYVLAWAFDLLLPSIFLLIIVLIVHPPSRSYLFPPAPLAAINAATGNVKLPKAGAVGSTDSLTGAEELHKGEASEREASNFVTGLASIAIGSAVGKKEDAEQKAAGKTDDKIPDPSSVLDTTVTAAQNKTSKTPDIVEDHTKKPIQDSMWNSIRPIIRALSDLADGWERFANALTPTPPYKDFIRLKLAGIIAALFFGSLIITPWMIYKGITAGIGVGLFLPNQYAMAPLNWLNENYPGWPAYLELRSTLLRGVPTNAQLTLTLLRLGEAEQTPLPPPPLYAKVPEEHATEEPDVPSDYEMDMPSDSEPEVPDGEGDGKKHKGRKFAAAIKGALKGGVNASLGVDRVKAAIGSEHARQRMGALPKAGPPETKFTDGPTVYKGRFHGKRGYLTISTTATTPCVAFRYNRIAGADKAEFSIQLADIRSLRKLGGFGFKTKLLVGYILGQEVADGIEIVDSLGDKYAITAIIRRDEVFNRLIAISHQKWESW